GVPIGPGPRVPTILVSPWTHGGYVCSEIFDHTSILQFLEQWTGVQEPNISDWRRDICGDLTTAFNFGAPNTNYPALPAPTTVSCTGITPGPPSIQSLPAQESGVHPSRPLPYQLNAVCFTDCGDSGIW